MVKIKKTRANSLQNMFGSLKGLKFDFQKFRDEKRKLERLSDRRLLKRLKGKKFSI